MFVALLTGSSAFVFNSSLFHVTLSGTYPPRPPCILDRDVHLLSGNVTQASGGIVNVTVVNGTLPDYELVFGPAIHDRGFIVHNVTARLPCNGTAVAVAPGYAGCQDPSTGGKDFCNAIMFADDPSPDVPPHNHWLLSVGVNPPLPPVPCNAVYDESACDAKDACRWCSSEDGRHALCFTKGHTPGGSQWVCSR